MDKDLESVEDDALLAEAEASLGEKESKKKKKK